MQYADTYEACIYDACMCDACQKWGRTNGRTDGKLNSRSRIYLASYTLDMIHVYMMHVSMMHVYVTLTHEP